MTALAQRIRAGDKDAKKQALDKIRKLNGDRPYNDGGNICRGDGYFANSIVRDYGMSISELSKLVGYKSDAQIEKSKDATIRRLREELRAVKAELASIKAAGRVVDRIDV